MITNRNTNAISCETKSPFHSVGTVTRKDDGRSTRDSNNAGSNPSLRMRKLSKTSTKFLITLRELLLLRRLLKQTLDVTVAPILRILGQANPVCRSIIVIEPLPPLLLLLLSIRSKSTLPRPLLLPKGNFTLHSRVPSGPNQYSNGLQRSSRRVP